MAIETVYSADPVTAAILETFLIQRDALNLANALRSRDPQRESIARAEHARIMVHWHKLQARLNEAFPVSQSEVS